MQAARALGGVAGQCGAGLAFELEQPMGAAALVVVEDFAVVAAHAFRLDDLALANRAPLAGLLAEGALAAFRPAFDLEYRGGARDEAERCAERA